MDPWTTTDIETLLAALASLETAVWSLRHIVVGVLVISTIKLGWTIGSVLLPSGEQMAWDGK